MYSPSKSLVELSLDRNSRKYNIPSKSDYVGKPGSELGSKLLLLKVSKYKE